MRIERVETWLVEGAKYNWTILRITTEDGLTGIGEATNWPGSPIVHEAVRHAGSRILGDDSRRIDFIWTKLYRDLNWLGPTGAVLCAISGIDMALHDLNARRLGVPMYQLLGGAFRTEVELYGNYWFIGGEHTPEDYARQAKAAVKLGFTALKFDPFVHTNYFYGQDLSTNLALTPAQEQRAVDVVAAVREALGPQVLMLIETHALLDSATAVRMAGRLEEFSIGWYEEPVGPENAAALAALKRRIRLPIAVGERHYTRFGIREVLELGAVDYLMPDVARCGGPGELRRMAALAETYYVSIAPHNPNGPLSTLASAHVCAAIPNFFRLEFIVSDVPWRDTIVSQPLDVSEGLIRLSERPGLGVELVDSEIAAHPGIVEPRPGYYV
ncbi:mandelate racemase/muconate lactonizing enzyme family protein [soil metagenome]